MARAQPTATGEQPANETVHTVATPEGYPVPVTWYAGEAGAPVILVLPALGVSVRFYTALAERLAAAGFNVVLMEQRGQGVSRLRPSRSRDRGFGEIVENDLPSVMDWARRHADEAPLYLLGHSLGGHYAAMAAARYPDQVEGLILVATGSPWLEAFDGKWQRRIRMLTRLIPPANLLFGYFPGKRFGFGGNEARTVMSDWRRLARSNRYQANRARGRSVAYDFEAGIAAYTGPLLVLVMGEDDFAPPAAVRAVTGKFERARLSERRFDGTELGARADHFRWARRPEPVVAAIRQWFETSALAEPLP